MSGEVPVSAEHERLANARNGSAPWRLWGPYLAERAWGTVREDYSADGDAWRYFPGTKTDCWVCAMMPNGCASRYRCGTARTPF
jgi:hypothetical protein